MAKPTADQAAADQAAADQAAADQAASTDPIVRMKALIARSRNHVGSRGTSILVHDAESVRAILESVEEILSTM